MVPPASGRLTALRAPILRIVGSLDTPFIRDVARAIAAQTPHVQGVDLPGVGHMVNLEAPIPCRDALMAFLAR